MLLLQVQYKQTGETASCTGKKKPGKDTANTVTDAVHVYTQDIHCNTMNQSMYYAQTHAGSVMMAIQMASFSFYQFFYDYMTPF